MLYVCQDIFDAVVISELCPDSHRYINVEHFIQVSPLNRYLFLSDRDAYMQSEMLRAIEICRIELLRYKSATQQ